MADEATSTRSVLMEDSLWEALTRAAGARQVRTGTKTSAADLIRQGGDVISQEEAHGLVSLEVKARLSGGADMDSDTLELIGATVRDVLLEWGFK